MTNFRPLGDRVLIKRVETVEKIGSIILAQSAQEKPQEGEVLAISGDREMSVAVGDRVLFGKWSGADVKIDGEELLIMHETDILGVIG